MPAAPVLARIARARVILQDIRCRTVPEAEEAGLVRFQAVKELTDTGDDVIIGYTTGTDRGAPEQRALPLIARKAVVLAYQARCHAAGPQLAAMPPPPVLSAAAPAPSRGPRAAP